MKCRHVQNRLLATSGRRSLSADVVSHLHTCEVCQKWHAGLTRLDRAVTRLPVPDSTEAKSALVAQFLEPVAPSSGRIWSTPMVRWIAVSIAASIAILALGSVMWKRGERRPATHPTADPLLARVIDRNLEMAHHPSVEKRLGILAGVADDLNDETRSLTLIAHRDDLKSLADMYTQVVRDGLLKQAEDVQPAEREKVLLPIADRLRATQQDFERRSQDAPADVVGPLKTIASVARDANIALRKLTKDDKVAHEAPAPKREGQS